MRIALSTPRVISMQAIVRGITPSCGKYAGKDELELNSRNRLCYERGVNDKSSIVSGMAGRYATALFELALEEQALDAVKADLDGFDALVKESPDLARLVRSPMFSSAEQLNAITAILDRAGIGGLAANLLKLAARNRRLFAVRDMSKAFRSLFARQRGEVSASLTVAEPPSERQLGTIKDALKSVTGGKSVDLTVNIEPAIIGGLIVRLGSRMVDNSLRTKLNAMRHGRRRPGRQIRGPQDCNGLRIGLGRCI
jgi:F-type H+-transporting ATPase subunit delta